MSDLQLLGAAIAALLAALGFRAFKNSKNASLLKSVLDVAQKELEKQNVRNAETEKKIEKNIAESESSQAEAIKKEQNASKEDALSHWNRKS